MKYLRTIRDEDVFKKVEFAAPDRYELRPTVKVVVKNEKKEYAFVTNPVHGFLLLPGGGAESKDLEAEARRECEEEIMFRVEILGEVGRIHEFRNREKRESETVCFSARTIEQVEHDTRTEEEKQNGLYVVWLSKEAALSALCEQEAKLSRGEVRFYNTAFNILRDGIFFREYLKKEVV